MGIFPQLSGSDPILLFKAGNEMTGGRKTAGQGNLSYTFVCGNKQLFRFAYPDKTQIIHKASANDLFK